MAETITFQCQTCKAVLKLNAAAAGRQGKCPHCRSMLTVPILGPIQDLLPIEPTPARPQFTCPFCKTTAPPMVRNKIAAAGWVVFIILLLACFPLCFLGIFIKDDYRVCSACGITLG